MKLLWRRYSKVFLLVNKSGEISNGRSQSYAPNLRNGSRIKNLADSFSNTLQKKHKKLKDEQQPLPKVKQVLPKLKQVKGGSKDGMIYFHQIFLTGYFMNARNILTNQSIVIVIINFVFLFFVYPKNMNQI